MPDLTAPLNDDELAQLQEDLINRFLTAIVSVPEMLLPSQWWPQRARLARLLA